MRERMLEAKPGVSPWDVKNILGGITDIAFILQFLSLTAGDGRALLSVTATINRWRDRKALTPEQSDILLTAQTAFDNVLHASRAATGGVFVPEAAGEALARKMADLCGARTLAEAEARLLSLQRRVANVYRQVVGLSPARGE
jgi:glutamate-ammonia-ligase adenylyltransferase